MTDEECIALAMLHGATIWPTGSELARRRGERGQFTVTVFAIDRGFNENISCLYDDGSVAYNKGNTAAEACRAYCIRHKLLPEVTDGT